jgi:hypothetical protein
MPYENENLKIPKPRVPVTEVWVGEPSAIFGERRGDFTYADKFNDEWDGIYKTQIGYMPFQHGGCITLKPRFLVENTRLYGANKAHLDTFAESFRTTHYPKSTSRLAHLVSLPPPQDPKLLKEGADALLPYYFYDELETGSSMPDQDDSLFGKNEAWRSCLSHELEKMTRFTFWGKDYGGNLAKVTAKATASSWTECAPDTYPSCIRLAQMRPYIQTGSGETTSYNWVMTRLRSQGQVHNVNPSIICQIEKRGVSKNQNLSQTVKGTIFNKDGTQTTGSFTFNSPMFAISFAADSADEITFIFNDGQPPIAVHARTTTVVEAMATTTVQFKENSPMTFSIRWVPPGYYEVVSDALTEPWLVIFEKDDGEQILLKGKDKIPWGSVSFTFLGMGVLNFAYAPMRYYKYGVLTTNKIDRNFPDSKCKTLDVKDYIDYHEVPLQTFYNPVKVKSFICVTPNSQFPDKKEEDEPEDYDETYYSRRKEIGGITDNQFKVRVETLSTDTTFTPYIYNTLVQYRAKNGNPDYTGMHRIGDTDDTLWYPFSRVRSWEISTDIVSNYCIKTNGSLTVSNNHGEWNKYISTTHTQPLQMAVKIYFKWVNAQDIRVDKLLYSHIDNTPVTINTDSSLSSTLGQHNKKLFDPNNPDDDQYCVFTGWMVSKSIARKIGNRKEANFTLKDRWHQLDEIKIFNSRFYDGTLWVTAMKDVLKLGGVKEAEIDMTGIKGTYLEKYTLPFAPAVAQKPQFKFPFATPCTKAIEQLNSTTYVFMYCDRLGHFVFKKPSLALNAAPVTFYDRITDAPDAESAWYSLGPFNWSESSESVYNWVTVGGPHDDYQIRLTPERVDVYDIGSLSVPTAPNYIGYKKNISFVKPYLIRQRDRVATAMKMLNAVRMPIEDVSWSSPLVTLEPYTTIKFSDSSRGRPDSSAADNMQPVIAPTDMTLVQQEDGTLAYAPVEKTYWLQSNKMSFTAEGGGKATSALTAKRMQSMFEL